MGMTSKASFISRGILQSDLKRFWWISAGYLLGMLSVPLAILTVYGQMEQAVGTSNYPMFVNQLLQVFRLTSPPLQPVLLILVPIAIGLILFQYLQDGRAADMFHALPVKRSTLYNTHILSGLLFLTLPLLFTGLISWVLITRLGMHQVVLLTILAWFGLALLFNLLFFLLSVVTGMVTGMSTVQGALSLVLLLLPSGLGMLLLANAKMYVYGFALDYYLARVSAAVSPLFQLLQVQSIHAGAVIAYLLVCAVLYLLGLYLYQRRRLEAAGDAIVFGFLRPVFKYGVAFCAMLLVGYYFSSTQNGSLGWTYFGYLLGSLVAYFLCEALLRKSLSVFHRQAVQGYGVFALVMVLLIVWLQFGAGGFEQRLPAENQVQSVYLGNVFPFPGETTAATMIQGPIQQEYSPILLPQPVYQDAASIADIYDLQRALIASRSREKALGLANESRMRVTTPLYLIYNLKNGSHFVRQYHVNLSDYGRQLKPLYESREYRYLHNPILSVNPADVAEMSITPEPTEKGVQLADQEQLRKAVAALQNDLLQQTYEQMTSGRPEWANIDILLQNGQMTELPWEKSDVNFSRYLQNIGAYDNARIMPDDLQCALVLKTTGAGSVPTDNQTLLALENSSGCLKVTDSQQLESCLLQYTGQDQQPYQVIFVLKGGNTFAGAFSGTDAPAFVKKYFAARQ
jgi:ABC-2 type transport system permease protein